MDENLDLYTFLNGSCPFLTKLIGPDFKNWQSINHRYKQRIEHINRELTLQPSITIETTIYDLIVMANEGDLIASKYLKYINHLFQTIHKKIPTYLEKKFIKSIEPLLLNFDERSSKYQNVIGEYSALLKILSLDEINYDLINIEYPLTNGKFADFNIKETTSGNNLLIEIYNIHVKERMIKSEEELETFLIGRIQSKVNDKLKGLDNNLIKSKFVVLPILWCNLGEMKLYETFFEKFGDRNRGINCFAFGQTRDEDGEINFIFDSMKNLLKDLKTD